MNEKRGQEQAPKIDRPVRADGTELSVGVGDGAWADIAEPVEFRGRIERVVLLRGGTRDGNPTVEVLIRTTDGRLVHANTTWRLWQGATRAFEEYEVRNGGGWRL
jgi:hypothetical protein